MGGGASAASSASASAKFPALLLRSDDADQVDLSFHRTAVMRLDPNDTETIRLDQSQVTRMEIFYPTYFLLALDPISSDYRCVKSGWRTIKTGYQCFEFNRRLHEDASFKYQNCLEWFYDSFFKRYSEANPGSKCWALKDKSFRVRLLNHILALSVLPRAENDPASSAFNEKHDGDYTGADDDDRDGHAFNCLVKGKGRDTERGSGGGSGHSGALLEAVFSIGSTLHKGISHQNSGVSAAGTVGKQQEANEVHRFKNKNDNDNHKVLGAMRPRKALSVGDEDASIIRCSLDVNVEEERSLGVSRSRRFPRSPSFLSPRSRSLAGAGAAAGAGVSAGTGTGSGAAGAAGAAESTQNSWLSTHASLSHGSVQAEWNEWNERGEGSSGEDGAWDDEVDVEIVGAAVNDDSNGLNTHHMAGRDRGRDWYRERGKGGGGGRDEGAAGGGGARGEEISFHSMRTFAGVRDRMPSGASGGKGSVKVAAGGAGSVGTAGLGSLSRVASRSLAGRGTGFREVCGKKPSRATPVSRTEARWEKMCSDVARIGLGMKFHAKEYGIFGEVLFSTLRECLGAVGEGAFTPAVERSWVAVYSRMLKPLMIKSLALAVKYGVEDPPAEIVSFAKYGKRIFKPIRVEVARTHFECNRSDSEGPDGAVRQTSIHCSISLPEPRLLSSSSSHTSTHDFESGGYSAADDSDVRSAAHTSPIFSPSLPNDYRNGAHPPVKAANWTESRDHPVPAASLRRGSALTVPEEVDTQDSSMHTYFSI